MTTFEKLQNELGQLPADRREAWAAHFLHELEEESQEFVSPLPDPIPFERIEHLLGSLEGPGDLSTNPKYMEGFGESSRR